ncbi:shikimate kinase [Clostridium tetanomorphum]|uniref:Shikimate kinase n=2 Tax=Clostridium tetanomorphum TaxID=1553 RepID=A0A923J047_CLOTT|nr:shikimate kinase [Clostridium tetanomorphum]
MPGSGKSTIGFELSKRLNKNFYDVDKYIEEIEKRSINEIFKMGEEYFREIESKAIEEISKKNLSVIATGGGAIKLKRNMDILRENGIVIFINRSLKNIFEDIDIEGRPLLKNDKERLYKLYEERYSLYKKFCDYEVINDDNLENVINNIVNILNEVIR